jgi:hypothetical protein
MLYVSRLLIIYLVHAFGVVDRENDSSPLTVILFIISAVIRTTTRARILQFNNT